MKEVYRQTDSQRGGDGKKERVRERLRVMVICGSCMSLDVKVREKWEGTVKTNKKEGICQQKCRNWKKKRGETWEANTNGQKRVIEKENGVHKVK